MKHVDLQTFIPRVSPKYSSPRHLAPMTDLFERIAKGEEVFGCVSAPPRVMKTETLGHGLAWLLRKRPEMRIAYVSYSQTISEKKSRRFRGVAEVARVRLDPNAASLHDWRTLTTSKGAEQGGVWATSIMGAVVGEGFDLVIVDDPVKDRVSAESALIRGRTLEYVQDTLLGRGEPGCSFLVVMHRWHPSDLVGSLVSAGWESVVLPAILPDGSAICPERFSVEAYAEKRKKIGEYAWWSLYMQQPIVRGGSLFVDVHVYESVPEGCRTIIGVDFAYSTSSRSDYSVAVVCSVTTDRTYYVREVVRRQVPAPDFASELLRLRTRYPGATFASYASGTEKGTIDFMARHGVNVVAMPARLDKFNRAQLTIAAWNAGRVLVPREALWLNPFVGEVLDFSGVHDRHDDQVDALVSAFDAKAGSLNAARMIRAYGPGSQERRARSLGMNLTHANDWPRLARLIIK